MKFQVYEFSHPFHQVHFIIIVIKPYKQLKKLSNFYIVILLFIDNRLILNFHSSLPKG